MTTLKVSKMTKKEKQTALAKILEKHGFWQEAEDVLNEKYSTFSLCKKAYGDSYSKPIELVFTSDTKNLLKLAKSLKISFDEYVEFD